MGINSLPSSYILAADIGGSHITVGVCDTLTYTISEQSIIRVEVNSKGSADEVLKTWGGTFQQVINDNPTLQVSGIAIAMPGPFDYERGVCYIKGLNKYEALYGLDIRKYLAAMLKLDPHAVRFRNDAESTIAGEVLKGAGKGFVKVLGITLGTGFGSAYSKSEITSDINLGSEPYRKTIADDYFSTRWFQARFHELTGISLTGGVRELAQLTSESAVARRIFKEFAINLGDFLSGPIGEFDPDALVICGNIAKASHIFVPELTRRLKTVIIKITQLNENAALIGAAALFHDQERPISF